MSKYSQNVATPFLRLNLNRICAFVNGSLVEDSNKACCHPPPRMKSWWKLKSWVLPEFTHYSDQWELRVADYHMLSYKLSSLTPRGSPKLQAGVYLCKNRVAKCYCFPDACLVSLACWITRSCTHIKCSVVLLASLPLSHSPVVVFPIPQAFVFSFLLSLAFSRIRIVCFSVLCASLSLSHPLILLFDFISTASLPSSPMPPTIQGQDASIKVLQ